ncbi:14378_t:CDS:2 [Acaulospora morrowiae]|uniref:14378_t:CDS:1 n=1 Tax=Acaulospora morrowiae TaxID=94023 RepID=A0A9N9BDM3_9GLOM|nr:14378_t:CDS:2 [Acaulospora morrowiae]
MFEACIPITRDGVHYVRWIHTLFGACRYGSRDAISFLLGYASIACWLNAQLPQVITNYRNKSADGLSFPFLCNWLLGDITNLIGCLLTKQLPFQTYLAVYFCIVDLGLFFQYFYYTWYRAKPKTNDEQFEIPIKRNYHTFPTPARKYKRISSMVFAVLLFTFHSTSTISSSLSTSPSGHLYSKSLSTDNDESTSNASFIGRIMAWTCTVLYLTSRMPQIWKNYVRRSVEGLSIFMFIFAALGNLTYTISIFTNPIASSDPKYLHEAVPYILGSVGTLAFDVTIFLQWCAWRDPGRRRRLTGDFDYQKLSDGNRYRDFRAYNERSGYVTTNY